MSVTNEDKPTCHDFKTDEEPVTFLSLCKNCGQRRCNHDLQAVKLSELCKRQQVRAYAIRDTDVFRFYGKWNREVVRKIKEGTEICGGHAFTQHGYTIVHVNLDDPSGLPCDYWYLPSKDFQWMAEVNVIIDTD